MNRGKKEEVMKQFAIPFALVALAATTPVIAAKRAPISWPELGVETSISLPNRYIRNFEADGDKGIWIEDIQRRWYYGTFKGRCTRLEHAQGIAYDTGGSTTFDKTSTIFVGDDFCEMTSLVTAEKPLSRKDRKRLAKEAMAKTPAN
jgi:Family of unknown function (DUF6491)